MGASTVTLRSASSIWSLLLIRRSFFYIESNTRSWTFQCGFSACGICFLPTNMPIFFHRYIAYFAVIHPIFTHPKIIHPVLTRTEKSFLIHTRWRFECTALLFQGLPGHWVRKRKNTGSPYFKGFRCLQGLDPRQQSYCLNMAGEDRMNVIWVRPFSETYPLRFWHYRYTGTYPISLWNVYHTFKRQNGILTYATLPITKHLQLHVAYCF